MYDYFLGGYHNLPVDRDAAEQIIALNPDTPFAVQANRAFLRRSVRYLIAQGVDQFLDLGSGIPTAGNVHQIAQAVDPAARVVYVDIDSVAVAHSRRLLKDDPRAMALLADARQPQAILDHPSALQQHGYAGRAGDGHRAKSVPDVRLRGVARAA